MNNKIQFDRDKYLSLKTYYEKAVSEEREQIVFEGHIILTSYVKIMLMRLENELKIKKD